MSFLGCYVKPDQWALGENLIESDGFSDSSFPGCQYRLPSSRYIKGDPLYYEIAVNIRITGRKSFWDFNKYRTRIEIEFVGDGEPSTFTHGWLYTEQPLKPL